MCIHGKMSTTFHLCEWVRHTYNIILYYRFLLSKYVFGLGNRFFWNPIVTIVTDKV